MEKTIKIGSKDVKLKASALLPRIYRNLTGKDLIIEMTKLQSNVGKKDNLGTVDLQIFEDIAWCMAYHADKNIPDNPDDWLESLDGVCDIYEVLPQIIELWSNNIKQTSTPVKK